MICFACARRFPYHAQKRNASIKKALLLERLDQGEGEAMQFCGLTLRQTDCIFGLSTYVQKYDQMSGEVHLDESHNEFADWRIDVPFGAVTPTTVCCSEGVRCDGDVPHGRDTCCT